MSQFKPKLGLVLLFLWTEPSSASLWARLKLLSWPVFCACWSLSLIERFLSLHLALPSPIFLTNSTHLLRFSLSINPSIKPSVKPPPLLITSRWAKGPFFVLPHISLSFPYWFLLMIRHLLNCKPIYFLIILGLHVCMYLRIILPIHSIIQSNEQ